VVTQPGNNVEMKTRRTYFLDCPAGYKPGDKVNLVLSLHGGRIIRQLAAQLCAVLRREGQVQAGDHDAGFARPLVERGG
jgi:hypothetical protein